MALTETKLINIIARRLTRRGGLEEARARELAEDIVDDISNAMDVADVGSGIRPIRMAAENEERELAKEMESLPSRLRQPSAAIRPVTPGDREEIARAEERRKLGIVIPGDKEFHAPEQTPVRRIAPVALERVGGVRTGAPVEYWRPEQLIAETEQNTPKYFIVEPAVEEGEDPIRVRMNRNIINCPGLGVIELRYSPGSQNETEGGIESPPAATPDEVGDVKIGQYARVLLELADPAPDFEAVMRSIEKQAWAICQPRGEVLEPHPGRHPGALRLDMGRQPGDTFKDRLQPGAGGRADAQAAASAIRQRLSDQNRAERVIKEMP